jgi:hypothetical protein
MNGVANGAVAPPYDERIGKIRASLADATRSVSVRRRRRDEERKRQRERGLTHASAGDTRVCQRIHCHCRGNAATAIHREHDQTEENFIFFVFFFLSLLTSFHKGIMMRMQREIDMARMARDQYHAARDDLWRENEKLRAELAKLKQAPVQPQSPVANARQANDRKQTQQQLGAIDLAVSRSKSERKPLADADRAAERAREVTSTLRLSRKSGGAKEQTELGKDKEYIELQTSRNAVGGQANLDLYVGIGTAAAGMAGNDERSAPRDQYQAIDAAIADADLAASRPNDPMPPSPSKPPMTINGSLGPPPPPGVPPRANMVASNDVSWPTVERDPNYASLPVTSKAVPNAVANTTGETYGDVPNW